MKNGDEEYRNINRAIIVLGMFIAVVVALSVACGTI